MTICFAILVKLYNISLGAPPKIFLGGPPLLYFSTNLLSVARAIILAVTAGVDAFQMRFLPAITLLEDLSLIAISVC